jgi:hypothetical protein
MPLEMSLVRWTLEKMERLMKDQRNCPENR